MHPKFTDANSILKFGREKIGRFFLGLGVACLAVGIFGVSFDQSRDRKPTTYLLVVFGFGLTGYGMHRTFDTKRPLLVLSPTGLALDIEWTRRFVVPWHEVRGVKKTSQGIVAATVSKDFYDRNIHVANPLLRGPGWNSTFVQTGDTVEIRLNSKVIAASLDQIFTALEARWMTFRNNKPSLAAARKPWPQNPSM